MKIFNNSLSVLLLGFLLFAISPGLAQAQATGGFTGRIDEMTIKLIPPADPNFPDTGTADVYNKVSVINVTTRDTRYVHQVRITNAANQAFLAESQLQWKWYSSPPNGAPASNVHFFNFELKGATSVDAKVFVMTDHGIVLINHVIRFTQ